MLTMATNTSWMYDAWLVHRSKPAWLTYTKRLPNAQTVSKSPHILNTRNRAPTDSRILWSKPQTLSSSELWTLIGMQPINVSVKSYAFSASLTFTEDANFSNSTHSPKALIQSYCKFKFKQKFKIWAQTHFHGKWCVSGATQSVDPSVLPKTACSCSHYSFPWLLTFNWHIGCPVPTLMLKGSDPALMGILVVHVTYGSILRCSQGIRDATKVPPLSTQNAPLHSPYNITR